MPRLAADAPEGKASGRHSCSLIPEPTHTIATQTQYSEGAQS